MLPVTKLIYRRWEDTDREKPKYAEKNLSKPHTVYHKSHAEKKKHTNFWPEKCKRPHVKHWWAYNIKTDLTGNMAGMWEMEWSKSRVTDWASFACPAVISLLRASPHSPRHLPSVFWLYICSFHSVLVTGTDGGEVCSVIDWRRRRPTWTPIDVHSFPDPTVFRHSI
jgi:hypothetical protein